MTTASPSSESDLFDVLSAITIMGPDADGLLWVSFTTEDTIGAFSLQADSIAGKAVTQSRDLQTAALTKTESNRPSQSQALNLIHHDWPTIS